MSIQSGQPSSLRVNTRLGASFMYSYTLDGAAAANPKFQILPTLGAVGEDSQDEAPQNAQMGPENVTMAGPTQVEPQAVPVSIDGMPTQQPQTAKVQYHYGPAMPMAQPPLMASQVVSDAMFGEPTQAWNIPWSEWDPAILHRMDVDSQKMSSDGGSMM